MASNVESTKLSHGEFDLLDLKKKKQSKGKRKKSILNGMNHGFETSAKIVRGKEYPIANAEPAVGFLSLFRYSNPGDKLLICIGSMVAVCSGVFWPVVMIIFGNYLDIIIVYARTQRNITILADKNYSMTKDLFLEETGKLCLYNASMGLCIFISNYIIVSTFSHAAANQALSIRCRFMASILKQDISWHDTNKTSDFAGSISGDLNRIQDGIGEKVGIFISYLSTSIICYGMALYYGWKLALVSFCITPIISIAMGVLSKLQAAASSEELKAHEIAGTVAEEVFSSIRTVVAFGSELKEIQRYEKCLIPANEKAIKQAFLTSIGSALTWFGIFAGYALAFWYGVKLVVENRDLENPEYTPGILIIVFFNVVTGSLQTGQAAPYFEAFSQARGAAGKVFAIILSKPYIDSSSKFGKIPAYLKGKIELKNVHFNYPARPNVSVLQGISLTVNTGETIALLGPSGCGKSTIIQMILRFYDTDKGCIDIDENNVKDLNVGWLRRNIGLVSQEPMLFSASILENILQGKPSATFEEVVNSAILANAHEFISSLPLKYDTLVGERGIQLSGGQKQRIAVARALIKNPKILLLDEATSALDLESEKAVQFALDQACQGRTTIIIAHRLSTIKNVDKIFVISNGVIQEVGTHDQLMEKSSIYYHLVLSQTKEISENERYPSLSLQTSAFSSKSINFDDISPGMVKRQISSVSCIDESCNRVCYEFKEKGDGASSFSWSRITKLSYPEWPHLILGAISSVTMGVHIPLYGVLFGSIMGILSEETDKMSDDINFYCLLFFLLAITSFIASFLQVFMFSLASVKLTNRLKNMMFYNIITQNIAWFDLPQNNVGSLCSKLSSNVSDMQGATGSRMAVLFQSLSTLIACVTLALYYYYKIGCLVFAFVPAVLAAMYIEGRVAAAQILKDKIGLEKASKVAVEAIDGIRTVASLHQEEYFYLQFRNALMKCYVESKKKFQVRAVTFGFSLSVQSYAYAAAMFYGSHLIATDELEYADLFKVMEGIIVSTAVLSQIITFSPDFQKAKVAASLVFEILDLGGVSEVLSGNGHSISEANGDLCFRNVHFNYPSRPSVEVLQDLNLDVKSGKTVALVGSSGCGKSTCIQLIERFYGVQGGDVMLDGINIKDLSISSLRSHIGLVSQEPTLFSYSIADNISYGDPSENTDMDKIMSAARQANIHSFISSLPEGYHTVLGSKGTQLSGGQKQRVAIARALFRNPKILLLDEATSALDANSERVVQEALDNAREGRTCLVVAHRLTTIQNADAIAVMKDGRIIEEGTHQELIKRCGHYYTLYNGEHTFS